LSLRSSFPICWRTELPPLLTILLSYANIALPAPHQEGGMPLMQALKQRKTSRAFSEKRLPPQQLSDMLWAAVGINRADGKRTAPSTRNWQEMEIYVVSQEGVYLYDPQANQLVGMVPGDLRAMTSVQSFVAAAPINLIYVADRSKAKTATDDDWVMYSATDAAFISQNVYLYCASENLATVVRGGIDRKALGKLLGLPESKRVVLAQTVGYAPGE
jgi:nitroreductase